MPAFHSHMPALFSLPCSTSETELWPWALKPAALKQEVQTRQGCWTHSCCYPNFLRRRWHPIESLKDSIHTYTRMHMYTHMHMYIHICIYTYTCTYTQVYIHTDIHTHIYLTHTHMYVCVSGDMALLEECLPNMHKAQGLSSVLHRAWQNLPVIPALDRQRQDQKITAILCYKESLNQAWATCGRKIKPTNQQCNVIKNINKFCKRSL